MWRTDASEMSRMLFALPVLKEGYIVAVYGPPPEARGGSRMDSRRSTMPKEGIRAGGRAVGDEEEVNRKGCCR